MSNSSKVREVDFYLDRSKEAAVRIVHSLITNPSITREEALQLVREIADHHDTIAAFIQDKLGGDSRGSTVLEPLQIN